MEDLREELAFLTLIQVVVCGAKGSGMLLLSLHSKLSELEGLPNCFLGDFRQALR
jgi:hypothetical protein